MISTPSGRRHLRKTWKFSAKEAIRAASGTQVSEVLFELGNLSKSLPQTLQVGTGMVTSKEFADLANTFCAGKQSGHSEVYSRLDLVPELVLRVLEIGIGTNDESAASSMGKAGIPGASLRMWAEFFPSASIFGADIDPKSHIFSDRITSLHLDSTNQASLHKLFDSLIVDEASLPFDLVIDDGLHTPESNLRVLNTLFPLVRVGGFYVVEDIPVAWKGFWSLIANSINSASWALVDSSTLDLGSHCFLILKKEA